MSVVDSTDGDAARQVTIDAAADLAELKRIELQMQLGFITRRGIMRICRVSSQTVALWIGRGLPIHNPGTGEAWCTLAAFREFSARGLSFPAVKPKRRSKKN
jgi:hypothetical protein